MGLSSHVLQGGPGQLSEPQTEKGTWSYRGLPLGQLPAFQVSDEVG